jgi:hypothetical protein
MKSKLLNWAPVAMALASVISMTPAWSFGAPNVTNWVSTTAANCENGSSTPTPTNWADWETIGGQLWLHAFNFDTDAGDELSGGLFGSINVGQVFHNLEFQTMGTLGDASAGPFLIVWGQNPDESLFQSATPISSGHVSGAISAHNDNFTLPIKTIFINQATIGSVPGFRLIGMAIVLAGANSDGSESEVWFNNFALNGITPKNVPKGNVAKVLSVPGASAGCPFPFPAFAN